MRKLLFLYPLFLLMMVCGWYFVLFRVSPIEDETLSFVVSILPYMAIYIWMMCIYDFQYKELGKNNVGQYAIVHVLLLCLMVLTFIRSNYLGIFLSDQEISFGMSRFNLFNIITLVLYLPVLVFVFLLTREYLYARSKIFTMIELVIPIIGIMTLSATILEEKKGGRESDDYNQMV